MVYLEQQTFVRDLFAAPVLHRALCALPSPRRKVRISQICWSVYSICVSEKLSKQLEQAEVRDGQTNGMLGVPVMRYTAQRATSARGEGGVWVTLERRCVSTLAYFGDKCCQLWMDERGLIARLVSLLLPWQTALLTQQGAGWQRWSSRDETTRQPNPIEPMPRHSWQLVVCPRKPKQKIKMNSKKTQNETTLQASRCCGC